MITTQNRHAGQIMNLQQVMPIKRSFKVKRHFMQDTPPSWLMPSSGLRLVSTLQLRSDSYPSIVAGDESRQIQVLVSGNCKVSRVNGKNIRSIHRVAEAILTVARWKEWPEGRKMEARGELWVGMDPLVTISTSSVSQANKERYGAPKAERHIRHRNGPHHACSGRLWLACSSSTFSPLGNWEMHRQLIEASVWLCYDDTYPFVIHGHFWNVNNIQIICSS